MSIRRFDATAARLRRGVRKVPVASPRAGYGRRACRDGRDRARCARARRRGGGAVHADVRRVLSSTPKTLQSTGIDLLEAAERCSRDVREALDFAAARIETYHAKQKPTGSHIRRSNGLELGWRWTPVDAVGLYVPGGRASYPSSVLMNAVPAKAAGVKRIVMVAPVPGGELNPAVAYAAVRAGVTEFYPIGGAQAVAALAYGAGRLKPVDKIVGPGNAYVAAAKRIVFGDVGIDTIAGPSEITVVADNQNDPEWIAADLLSQAEHDPLAQSILITDDAEWATRVEAAVEQQIGDPDDWRRRTSAAWRTMAPSSSRRSDAAADDREPDCAGARRARGCRSRRHRRGHSPLRRDLPRSLGARSAGRLCDRIQPRAADFRRCALCVRLVSAGLHEAHVNAAYR